MAGSPSRHHALTAAAALASVAEGIQIRRLAGSGAWVATSGSDASVAYEVAVTSNVAHGCDCLAGLNSDPVCKHRAAFYLLIGALTVPPEPELPAPLLTIDGSGSIRVAA